MSNHHNFERELGHIAALIEAIQERINFIAEQGVNVDQINQAIAKLSADVDALAAKPHGITVAEAQTITDAINAVGAKVTAALAA